MRPGAAIDGCYRNHGVSDLSPVSLCCSDTASSAAGISSPRWPRAVVMRCSSLRRAFIGLRTRLRNDGCENLVLASVRRAMTRIETRKSRSSQSQRRRFPRARQGRPRTEWPFAGRGGISSIFYTKSAFARADVGVVFSDLSVTVGAGSQHKGEITMDMKKLVVVCVGLVVGRE
jgi:hypothetical protein